MTSVSPAPNRAAARRRHRLNSGVKHSLRDIEIQLSLLNRQVGGHLGIRDPDYACQVIPHAKTEVFSDCSHLSPPHKAEPERLAEVLIDFWVHGSRADLAGL
jgi:hypothetical protein